MLDEGNRGAGFLDDVKESFEHPGCEFIAIEMFGDVVASLKGMGTHTANSPDALQQRLGIVWSHGDAGLSLFDDRAGLSADSHDDGDIEGHILEDFRGHHGAEEIGSLQMDEATVAGGDDFRHLFLGKEAGEADVGETFFGGHLFEFCTAGTVPDNPELDVVASLLFQGFGSIEHDFETVSHADRSDVTADEAVPCPEFLTDRRAVGSGELREIDAVGKDGDVIISDAAINQSLSVVITDGDDVIGGLIKFLFQPFECADDEVAFHGTDGDDRFGPEVADFENEGDVFTSGEHASPTAEELWRGGNRHIDVGDSSGFPGGAEHVAEEIDDPFEETFIGGEVGPDADDSDPLDPFFVAPVILIVVEDNSGGTVRSAGDDGHLMAGFDPATAMLEGPGGRCIDLGWEIMCEKQNMHDEENRFSAGVND